MFIPNLVGSYIMHRATTGRNVILKNDLRGTPLPQCCAITCRAVPSCRRRPLRYAPAPLLLPWAPKRLAPPSKRQRSSSFQRPIRSHAHRCSCLTRHHGGEQSGLVTLTFDLLILKVVSESRVTCANSSLPRPLCSRLRPDVRDRRQTCIIAKYPPLRDGGCA